MGKTYEDVSSVAKVLATIERARIIREVEEGMTPAERLEPLTSLSNWLFKDLFVDEAGVGKGEKYWTQHNAIIPPPVMASPLAGLCLVMNQGEGITVARREAESMNSVTESLGKGLEQLVSYTEVSEHKEEGGELLFRLNFTSYAPSKVCKEDKMDRVDDVSEWQTAAQLVRSFGGVPKHLKDYCAKEKLQL